MQKKSNKPDQSYHLILNDRAQDNWESLLAIADIAGGDWPQLACTAAVMISTHDESSPSMGIELLSDIQEIFEIQNLDRIGSAELIQRLCDDQ